MRASQTDWQMWLAASLFPFKLYVMLAVICLFAWHARLPAQDSVMWHIAIGDFNTAVVGALLGYVLSTVILVAGGFVQMSMCSRRAALWSFSFGVAGLIIGLILWYYTDQNYYDSMILSDK
jgi:LytS/YehU family sensor histidine kinase